MARALGASDYARRVERAEPPSFTPRRWVSYTNRWGLQAHLAIEAVKQDLAPVISVGSGEFDSHTEREYRNHRRSVERGIETVACICEGLERHAVGPDETLLDRTTIVVASEFSREPWINELGGKHHWPTNAMLFIGKGVRRSAVGAGPFVFGEADEQMYSLPIDPETGSPGETAQELGIGHALATVLHVAGIDPAPHLEEEPIPSLAV